MIGTMLASLTEKLLVTLRTLSGRGRLTEELLDELCRQLRTTLLEADVNVKVVKDFVDAIRAKGSDPRVQKNLNPEQQFIRLIHNELTSMMGEKATPLNFRVKPPAVFLVVGLQGAGKTTTVVKLAQYVREAQKKTVLLASTDVNRPAAQEQLATLADSLGIDHFESHLQESAKERAILAQEKAIRELRDVLILDTAGRLHVDEEMMEEMSDLASSFSLAETLLVLDAMTGQDAVRIGTAFQERMPLTGIVLTKLDGDARGGAALSLRAVTGIPIKFIGLGEKLTDFEVFHPDRLASRILDMGDLLSLAEKAQATLDPIETLNLAKKAKKNDFTLADFHFHLQQVKKMGSFENLMKFLPGMSRVSRQMKEMTPPDGELKRIEAIILSMTPGERVDHTLMNGSRRRRIASGSGTKVEDINRFMTQFLEARKMMTRLTKSGVGKRARVW